MRDVIESTNKTVGETGISRPKKYTESASHGRVEEGWCLGGGKVERRIYSARQRALREEHGEPEPVSDKQLTAAKEMAATAMPNLSAVESVVWAQRGSQVAQAPSRISDVQSISIRTAWTSDTSGWITVTQSGVRESGFPSAISSAGVTIFGQARICMRLSRDAGRRGTGGQL